jgi:hypothetical protein
MKLRKRPSLYILLEWRMIISLLKEFILVADVRVLRYGIRRSRRAPLMKQPQPSSSALKKAVVILGELNFSSNEEKNLIKR